LSTRFFWQDRYKLGFDPIDQIHEDFVLIVDSLLQSDDVNQIRNSLESIERHTIEHFDTENRWMIESDFPAAVCHMEEHESVLASIRDVVANFDAQLAKDLGMALMDWFPGHADYLDSALATWMVKQKFSASPLVFRRNPIDLDCSEHRVFD
jgi:hemerythrin